jgi:hypothetical protein
MMIHCSKNRSFIFMTRRRNTRLISATTSTPLELVRLNRNWCKLKHAQTNLYYDQVAWLPLSSAIKSFRKLHSHTLDKPPCFFYCHTTQPVTPPVTYPLLAFSNNHVAPVFNVANLMLDSVCNAWGYSLHLKDTVSWWCLLTILYVQSICLQMFLWS